MREIQDISKTEPNQSPAEAAAHRPPDAADRQDEDRFQRRRQRVREYLDKALSAAEPEVAMLGGISVDLTSLEMRIARAVDDLLGECQDAGDRLDAASEGLEMMLKISRQVERNTRLADELTRRQA